MKTVVQGMACFDDLPVEIKYMILRDIDYFNQHPVVLYDLRRPYAERHISPQANYWDPQKAGRMDLVPDEECYRAPPEASTLPLVSIRLPDDAPSGVRLVNRKFKSISDSLHMARNKFCLDGSLRHIRFSLKQVPSKTLWGLRYLSLSIWQDDDLARLMLWLVTLLAVAMQAD